MDTRFFGNNLIALHDARDGRRHLSIEAGEDAYYRRHAATDSRVLKIASAVVTVLFGFAAVGFWALLKGGGSHPGVDNSPASTPALRSVIFTGGPRFRAPSIGYCSR